MQDSTTPPKGTYINKCMHFTGYFYFALLNFSFGLFGLKFLSETLEKSCRSNEILVKNAETVTKTRHNRSRNHFFSGDNDPAPPRIFSHFQLHLSLDSYAFVIVWMMATCYEILKLQSNVLCSSERTSTWRTKCDIILKHFMLIFQLKTFQFPAYTYSSCMYMLINTNARSPMKNLIASWKINNILKCVFVVISRLKTCDDKYNTHSYEEIIE